MFYDNKDKYIGQVQDCIQNGCGIGIYENKCSIYGGWLKNKPHGYCVEISNNNKR